MGIAISPDYKNGIPLQLDIVPVSGDSGGPLIFKDKVVGVTALMYRNLADVEFEGVSLMYRSFNRPYIRKAFETIDKVVSGYVPSIKKTYRTLIQYAFRLPEVSFRAGVKFCPIRPHLNAIKEALEAH